VKTVSANLGAHLAGEVMTLCTCVKITRADAVIFGFTDHTENITVSGQLYQAATAYTGTAAVTSADLAVDNLDIEGVLDAATITEPDLLAGIWDYAAVEIFRVNYAAPADGVLWRRKGRLGQVKMGRATFVAELRGLSQNLAQTIGEVYTAACRANLFDSRCAPGGTLGGGGTQASLTVTGSVTSVTSNAVFVDTTRTEASTYFDGGLLTWTSGPNAGKPMEVKTWDGAAKRFTLCIPMVGTVAIGDAYSVYPGCKKRLIADCKTKFANVVNFRGEPYVPGEEAQWERV
jgi:uncharacterized phage protein (TIGR02218 family)